MDGFLAAVARHGIGIDFKDEVGDARLARRAGQMLAAYAEPHDDQMILEGFVPLGGGFLIDGHVHVAAHEGGDLGRDFHDRGGQHHGHDARREEHLVPVVVHEAAVHGGTGQHEGEFPDLREAHGGEDGDAQGVPHQQHGRQGQDGFQEDEQGREEEHLVQMVHEEAHVEQHTHGDEEQALARTPEGELEDVEGSRAHSDPESRSPARNAPRARERPSEAVPRAMAKHRPSTVMSMSSLLRVRSTSCMMRGTTWRARTQPPTRITSVRPAETSIPPRSVSPRPARIDGSIAWWNEAAMS